ncbi:MAG: hypothetical protein AAF664_00150 [Planctomycetota bacterium]
MQARHIRLSIAITLLLFSGRLQAQETQSIPFVNEATLKKFDSEVRDFQDDLTPEGKNVYLKAKTQPKPDNQDQKLVGFWHGRSEDADNASSWRYQRKADGTCKILLIDIDKVAQTYFRRPMQTLWRTEGQILYEFDPNDEDVGLSVYLIQELQEDRLVYQHVFTDVNSRRWPSDTDRKGPGPALKLPEGYEEMD